MNKYEAMFILKPDMNKEDLNKTIASIEEVINKNGGKVFECKQWARRPLAYSIKKFTEGEYYLCNFEVEPETVSNLEGAYKLNENILRTLIIKRG